MSSTLSQPTTDQSSDELRKALTPIYHVLRNYALLLQQKEAEDLAQDFYRQQETLLTDLPPVPALERLCYTFGLNSFERHLLLLCLCRVVFPDVPYWLTLAQENGQLDYVTFSLALRLFPHSQWQAILPTSPLRHWQLLLLNPKVEDISLVPLRVDEAIVHYLMESEYRDPYLSDLLVPASTNTPPLPPSHEEIAASITNLWSNFAAGANVPLVQLCSYNPGASEAIAATACHNLASPLYYLTAAALPNKTEELSQLVRRWHRQVKLVGGVLLLDCSLLQGGKEEALSFFVSRLACPVIICSEAQKNWPRKETITFDVPKLTHGEQLNLWQTNLGSVATELNGTVESLATNFYLTGATIQAACSTVVKDKGQRQQGNNRPPEPHPLAAQLWQFCRTQARPRLDDLAQRVDSKVTWEDLILPEETLTILQDLANQVQHRNIVYQQWGLASHSGRGLGVSALLSGDSGTGKTLASEVLANELNLDLYRIDLSTVVSKYIGETEKNLERIFSAAEGGGVVLLFDEADALFGKRTQVKDSHDRHANVEVSFLLQRMEAYQGLAVLTTNLKDSLDQAFLRRLRFVISFPFPDADSRSRIWQRMFPPQTPTKNLDYEKLGQLAMAGGNIRNIALNAAFRAANAQEAVMMKHILAATKAEAIKIDKILGPKQTAGWLD